jgi:hypothetical protein
MPPSQRLRTLVGLSLALTFAALVELADLGGGLVLRVASQIPTFRSLNGVQEERFVADVGLTYLVQR